MTPNQLEIVMFLRDRGIRHTKIAEMLEVSTTTVKRACSRIEKERKSTSEQHPICKECGKRIVYERKTRLRLFCCRKSAQAWWNKRHYTSCRASDETMLMSLGLLLDLLECHKQYNGLATPKRDLTIDDVIHFGV